MPVRDNDEQIHDGLNNTSDSPQSSHRFSHIVTPQATPHKHSVIEVTEADLPLHFTYFARPLRVKVSVSLAVRDNEGFRIMPCATLVGCESNQQLKVTYPEEYFACGETVSLHPVLLNHRESRVHYLDAEQSRFFISGLGFNGQREMINRGMVYLYHASNFLQFAATLLVDQSNEGKLARGFIFGAVRSENQDLDRLVQLNLRDTYPFVAAEKVFIPDY